MAYNQKDAIRNAFACREYKKATRLWIQYMDVLRGKCKGGALTRAEMDEARDLFEWARTTLHCQRAHIQQRLRGLQVAGAYCQPPNPARTGASFNGKL